MSRFSAFSYTEMMVIYDALRKQEEEYKNGLDRMTKNNPNREASFLELTTSTRLRDEINQYNPME